ncbi:hypothetical protein HYU14_06315 [Candidatus Woesearchaeota archaeon]|nr:hypothetical protein [Candidatus Woesearchaeota archaeon]
MQFEIQEDTSEKISEISKVMGIDKKEMIDRALLLYLDSIEKMVALKKEMGEWEILSDEALVNFERSL